MKGRWFRRLFSVRLASQCGDGAFGVALTSYTLFRTDQTSAAAIAVALAATLLPFSFVGPFTGVLLDRWSRRQVLMVVNLVRAGVVGVLAALVAIGVATLLFYLIAITALALNRFLLAGLSAALPHTVRGDDLVVANALTPTAGTGAFLVGLALGGSLRVKAGWLEAPDAAVLALASTVMLGAALLAARIPRDLLGPDEVVRVSLRSVARDVTAGLWTGVKHLGGRPRPRRALLALFAQRYLFGVTSVLVILLVRNSYNAPTETEAALTDLGLFAIFGGCGFVSAAFLTPWATRRWGTRRWLVGLMGAAGLTQIYPGVLLDKPVLLAVATATGVAAQSLKICTDTFVQSDIDDAFRGRIFSLYDVGFNLAFVGAAASTVVLLPRDGDAPSVVVAVGVGYVVIAWAYWRSTALQPA